MKENLKYDPEDLESLLLHKTFQELYPEERDFVLRHMESPGEYEALRKTLLEVIHSSRQEPWLEPDDSIKANLMKHYASEEHRSIRIWLNSLFAQISERLLPAPAVRYAFAGLAVILIGVTIWFNLPAPKEDLLAENTRTQQQEKVTQQQPSEAQPSPAAQAEIQLAEDVAAHVSQAPIPPAPQTVDEMVAMDSPAEPEVALMNETDSESDMAKATAVPDAALSETAANVGLQTESENNVGFMQDRVEELHTQQLDKTVILESVTIASVSRNRSKVKENRLRDSGGSAPLSELDQLLDILYTAP